MVNKKLILSCSEQGTFEIPTNNKKEAEEWIQVLKTLTFPKGGSSRHNATRGVIFAAIGRLKHMNLFLHNYQHRSKNKQIHKQGNLLYILNTPNKFIF